MLHYLIWVFFYPSLHEVVVHLLLIQGKYASNVILWLLFCVFLFALPFIQITELIKKKSCLILSSTLAISTDNIKLEDPERIFSLRSPSDYSTLLPSVCGYLIIKLQSSESLDLVYLCNHRQLFCQFDWDLCIVITHRISQAIGVLICPNI